jgi:hypothetical protein
MSGLRADFFVIILEIIKKRKIKLPPKQHFALFTNIL